MSQTCHKQTHIERVNDSFLEAGGSPEQYRAALARAINLGWLSCRCTSPALM
jgi:hypothetical protein